MTNTTKHPSHFIRANVIPENLSVTKVAKLLGMGRQALSDFLNGKSDLSIELATKIEIAFGASARELLDLQSRYDAEKKAYKTTASLASPYVPPFLEIRASAIEAWATSGIMPRSRLSVLIRTLIHSTNTSVTSIDFPGNDSSQLPGWDGKVTCASATSWVPEGHSGWEFGVNADIKGKADGDFQKSVVATEPKDREEMTFVFVTPRNWTGKNTWIRAQKAKELWGDVRAYDASDLEQWLEQSIAGQTWFANETGQTSSGVISLDKAWRDWSSVCDPVLTPILFSAAFAAHKEVLLRAVSSPSGGPTLLTADSREEALAFLSAGFSEDNADLGAYRDRILVFNEPGTLSKLIAKTSNFIPVIMSREVEKEFAPFSNAMPSFLIYYKNATNDQPDIALETLEYEEFSNALSEMGKSREEVDQLAKESGRSLTVLRRRLAKIPALKTPDWSMDFDLSNQLVPFVLAGAWNIQSVADRTILEGLAHDQPFDELEKRALKLASIESSPIWMEGKMRGLVSKTDALFAISSKITGQDINRFFEVAELVLGEDDPALDLPDEDRWAAAIHGKKREISYALRTGVCETLVLLAIYGHDLFGMRFSFDLQDRVDRFVHKLLEPLTSRKLESQQDTLKLYAEAAPDAFLKIIEKDLLSAEPSSMALMRPIKDVMFGGSSRTGLLWAIEKLAWSKDYFSRTVQILARLSEVSIDDNLSNKPTLSLASIFSWWLPQTSVSLEERKAAFLELCKSHPKEAWSILIEQLSPHSRIGHNNTQPIWRTQGARRVSRITNGEGNEYRLFLLDLALKWPVHSAHSICGLLSSLTSVDKSLHYGVWDLVDTWCETASEDDKIEIREKIRTTFFSRRAKIKNRDAAFKANTERVQLSYSRLEPTNPVFRNAWLFKNAWVDESFDEVHDEALDFEARDQRIAALRIEAVRDVLDNCGTDGLIRLARLGNASFNIGWALSDVVPNDNDLAFVLNEVLVATEPTEANDLLISGTLGNNPSKRPELLAAVLRIISQEHRISLLSLAPFASATWLLVASFGSEFAEEYWKNVRLAGWCHVDDVLFAAQSLVSVGRGRTAFLIVENHLDAVRSDFLFTLLDEHMHQANGRDTDVKLDGRDIRNALRSLSNRGEFSTEQLALLEFKHIGAFNEWDEERPVNLAKQVAEEPDWFVQFLVHSYKRSDKSFDPPRFQIENEAVRVATAEACHKALNLCYLIPGSDNNGTIDAVALLKWIKSVQTACRELSRVNVGDHLIGTLLSNAPCAEDDIWPCLEVRNVLEEVLTNKMGEALSIALFNSRGTVMRGPSGQQERDLASKYAKWAQGISYTHPRLASVFRDMEKSYLRDGQREDTSAKIKRRIG